MNPAPILELSDLSVAYYSKGTRIPAVHDVSFEIGPGEAVALVGESGCGKTTVALTVMRYLPSNSVIENGSAKLEGQDLLGISDHDLRSLRGEKLAMVYQEPGSSLNPSMRVGEQVAEVYRFHERVDRRTAMARACEMLKRVSLPNPTGIARSYPHQLSGGQQQRVVIAMALACNPRLLIMDEPTTGLDATVEAEVLDLIAELRTEFQAAMLFISHNLPLVAQLCERVVVLYAGRVVEQGESQKVFSKPSHPYTRGLVNCAPRFGATKSQRRLIPIPGTLPQLETLAGGCTFQPRCTRASPVCADAEPSLSHTGGDELVRCYHPLTETGLGADVLAREVDAEIAEEAHPVAAPTILSVSKLRKQFGDAVACDGLQLDVRRGEILGIVGESGSGKSTFARCIVGLTVADEGHIRLDGSEVPLQLQKRDMTTRRRIQMVFQSPDTTLNPRHSTGFILKRAIQQLRGRGTDVVTAVNELAQAVNLSTRQLDSRASQLSGGQRQRVAIARAFAGRPEVVICDEPVSALDVSVQATILNLLADLQSREKVTILFISHDLAVIRYLADRIAVMYLGAIVEFGRAADVFAPPHHPYTEALLSAIPHLGEPRRANRIRLRGEIPSLANVPAGCRFHTRCPRSIEGLCDTVPPPRQDLGQGHVVLCHLGVEELQPCGERKPTRPPLRDEQPTIRPTRGTA